VLEQVAKILKVPVETIKNFDEQTAINIISNTFHDSAFINNTETFILILSRNGLNDEEN
jgi:hypothetical protein